MAKDKGLKKASKYKKQAKRRGKTNRKLGTVIGGLIIAFILAFLFGYNGGMGDGSGEDSANGILDSAKNLFSSSSDSDDSNTEVTRSSTVSAIPTITIKEADIIYNNQSLTLEALGNQLEADGVSEVILVDQVAIIKYYTDTEDLLKEMGIAYTEKKATD